MITQSVIVFINSFTVKYKTKIKLHKTKKSSVREYTSDCHSYFKYCLHIEIIPANMVARQVQDYSVTSTHLHIWVRRGTMRVQTQCNDPQ